MGQDSPTSENRVLAALGYPMGIIALIVLLTDMKKNRFMHFHAVQALAFIIAGVAAMIGLSIVGTVLAVLPALRGLGILFAFLVPVVSLGWLVLTIVYAVRAYRGETFSIPVLNRFTGRYLPAT